MSRKINVNPDHYKTRGRERQGEDVVQEVHRHKFSETKRAAAKSVRPPQKKAPRASGQTK